MRRRTLCWAGVTALVMAGSMSIGRAQNPPPQSPSRPGAPSATTRGERTSTPPETPQRSTNSPQSAIQQSGTPPLVPNAYASTYKPFPSRTTLVRNATILTAAGPAIERGSILLQNGKIAAVGADGQRAGRCARDRCDRQVGDARRHRHALAPRRLCGARHRVAAGRQRDDQSEHRRSLGRAFASGRRIRSSSSRWPAA